MVWLDWGEPLLLGAPGLQGQGAPQPGFLLPASLAGMAQPVTSWASISKATHICQPGLVHWDPASEEPPPGTGSRPGRTLTASALLAWQGHLGAGVPWAP